MFFSEAFWRKKRKLNINNDLEHKKMSGDINQYLIGDFF